VSGVVVGFYGKVPARGDFVRDGLPRDFIDPWDKWLQSVMAGSRASMGEAWLPAFLEAPVWRFRLPRGVCGERAALGLMLPSVDKAGRYFPLTFAALRADGIGVADEAWLDRCEAAGRAALEKDSSPQEISAMLDTPDLAGGTADPREAVWWSDGSARIEPARLVLSGLPDAATYAAMLGAAEDKDAVAAAGETKWESTP
jgi:type VI secretion system protein ImpM